MKWVWTAAIVIVFAASAPRAAGDPFVQYLAGVELLRSARQMPEQEKAARYRRLCELTGWNAETAKLRLIAYSSKPESWKRIQQAMITVLESAKEEKKE